MQMELSSLINFCLLMLNWKVILILTLILAFYFYYTSTFDYFKKRGIPYMKPVLLLGNFGSRIIIKQSFHEFLLDIYKRFKGERIAGVFEGRHPVLYILDPDLIKHVLIRDFDFFSDRDIISFAKPRYFSRTLIALKGDSWRNVRSTMTPVFSSYRLKNMLPLVQHCGEHIVQYLKQYDNKDVEIKEAMGRYACETIGACAFGIDYETLTDQNSQFIKAVEKFNYIPKMKRVVIFLVQLFYTCSTIMELSFNCGATGQLVKVLKAKKAERRSTGSKKKDFLQMLVDVARKQSYEQNDTTPIEMDDDTIDAQCLLFLVAGYESSSTLLAFATYIMATRPDLQEKLRKHINHTTDGKEMTYELLNELDYLEAFLLETLRMYPPVPGLDRVVTKPYQIPETNILLKPGDKIGIPAYAIHMDPDHYSMPNEFRPERFLGEEKKNRPAHLFFAFGVGPRNCIGTRFAMMSTKLAMVSLVRNFKFSTCGKTEIPITFNKAAYFLRASSGLWVHVESLKIRDI